jgi:DNA invertase Pin-like site-specific DNA recombinase
VTAPTTPTELPGAEPAVLSGIKIGYARVSTGGQNLERQIDALQATGCRRIFAEKQPGRDTDRPELAACLAFMAPGDTLVVPALDRLSRFLQDLITTVGDLRRRGVGFTSLHESLDTTIPGGRLVFYVFTALAEFIRELIVSGTREGLAAARARGRVGGPTVVTPEIIRAARDMLPNPDASVSSIAKPLGISPGTLYNHIPDLRELRASGRLQRQVTAAAGRPSLRAGREARPHPHNDHQEGRRMTPKPDERAQIRAAIDRILAGAPITLASARKLLKNEDAMIYDNPHALGLCHYKRDRALCQGDGVKGTPSLDRCVPGCGNIARTD